MEDVVIKESKGKVLAITILIFIGIVFLILCTIFIFSLHDTLKNEIIDRLSAIVVTVGCSYFLVVWIAKLFHERIIMIIGKEGVTVPESVGFIPWRDVKSCEIIELTHYNQTGRGSSYGVQTKYIKIYVRRPDRYDNNLYFESRDKAQLIPFEYANMLIDDVLRLIEKGMKEYQKRNEGKISENLGKQIPNKQKEK